MPAPWKPLCAPTLADTATSTTRCILRAPHHRLKGAEILLARRVPERIVSAILAHADYSGLPRVSRLDRALYACDELSGFVHAVALVRPGRVIRGLAPSSVRKKLKDKAFARTVNRDDVYRGAGELGVDLDEHIAFVTAALTDVAPEIGLAIVHPEGAPRS